MPRWLVRRCSSPMCLAWECFRSMSAPASSSSSTHFTPMSHFWRWDGDGPAVVSAASPSAMSSRAAPCKGAHPGSKTSCALCWSPERIPKSHGGRKVGFYKKCAKRNPLGDVQHRWWGTQMLSLGILNWWKAAAALLSPPGPGKQHEAARCVQGSDAMGLPPCICFKILTR